MQKTSILFLSIVALLGLSAVAYAASENWTWYSKDYTASRPEGQLPNGDCLEMMCEHGCVENEKYEGWCCPNAGNTGDSCTVAEGIDANACCQSGVCDKGKCGCEENENCEGEQVCLPTKICDCPSGTSKYIKSDGTTGCCLNSTHVLAKITGSTNKACCPKETPFWDGSRCVECITDPDCEGEQVCLPNKTCGCPSGASKYTKSDGTTGCCVNSTHVLAAITSSTNKACCPKETPFWDGINCTTCPPHSSTAVREGAQIGTTGCYCENEYVVNAEGTECVILSCSAYNGTGIADTTTYTGAIAGKANDGVTDCKCPTKKPYWNGSSGICESPLGKSCTSYTANECGVGYYCQFSPTKCSSPGTGVCKAVGKTGVVKNYITKVKTNYITGEDLLDWWSAQSWCIGIGRRLAKNPIGGVPLNKDYESRGHGPLANVLGPALYWIGYDYGDSCNARFIFVMYIIGGIGVDDGNDMIVKAERNGGLWPLCE